MPLYTERQEFSRRFLYDMQCAENEVNHHNHDQCDTAMPEETHDKVKDAHNDVKEKSEDYEHDYQTKDDPKPRTDM